MRNVDPNDPNKFDDFTDDEFEEWTANFTKHATEKAEKFGLTEADLAPVLKAQQEWRMNRPKADEAEKKAAIAKAAAEDAGRNYLKALAEHDADSEIPN